MASLAPTAPATPATSTTPPSASATRLEQFQAMIDDFKEDLELQPLVDGDPVCNNRITVCIRKRPLSAKETKNREVDVATVSSMDELMIHEPKTKVDLTKYLENQQFR